MKFLKENISWIAPTVAIVLVASGFLDRDKGLKFFSAGTTQEAASAQATRPLSDLTETVQAAMAPPTGADAGLSGGDAGNHLGGG